MEVWDLYDENKQPLNEIHVRGEKMKEKAYHYVVFIWTFTKEGNLLLTQRHPCKSYPYAWEITGGSVVANETPLEGAKRELLEETGISAELDEFIHIGSNIDERTQCLAECYAIVKEIVEEDLQLQDFETIDAMLVSHEEFLDLCERKKVARPCIMRYQQYETLLKPYFKKEENHGKPIHSN